MAGSRRGFKHGAGEVLTQVDLALGSIIEPKPEPKSAANLDFTHVEHRWPPVEYQSSGGIGTGARRDGLGPSRRGAHRDGAQPFEDQGLRPPREVATHNAISNRDGDFELTVSRVEVRRVVIAVKNRDRDSEEAEMTGMTESGMICAV